jgi:hypothetical protein
MKALTYFLVVVLLSSCYHTKITDPKESCTMSSGTEWSRMLFTNTSSSKKLVVTYLEKQIGSSGFTLSITLEPGQIESRCIPKGATIKIVGEREIN